MNPREAVEVDVAEAVAREAHSEARGEPSEEKEAHSAEREERSEAKEVLTGVIEVLLGETEVIEEEVADLEELTPTGEAETVRTTKASCSSRKIMTSAAEEEETSEPEAREEATEPEVREAPGEEMMEKEKLVKVPQEADQELQEATDLQEPEPKSQKAAIFPESLPLNLKKLQSLRPRSER